jgi:hypothetical protein
MSAINESFEELHTEIRQLKLRVTELEAQVIKPTVLVNNYSNQNG